ncbi:MAG: hypothetical protein QG608_3251 [Actinomycetota bacterium]|nr:hypothetical protein [Actinomycetota bacterium]
MAAASDLHCGGFSGSRRGRIVLGAGACRFAHGIGQGHQIVVGRPGLFEIDREPDHFPSPGSGKSVCVLGTQVVAMRLGIGGERSQNGR